MVTESDGLRCCERIEERQEAGAAELAGAGCGGDGGPGPGAGAGVDRPGWVDEIVLSLYAKGLTTGEISAHFAEIYGASVSKETISRITDAVVAEMHEWSSRPLDATYVALFVDAIMVKVRDGQVTNRSVYAVIGVSVDGRKDVLGLWMGTGGEGAVENVWPHTLVPTCLIHLLRNSFRLVSTKHWDALKRDLKPIYTAPNADAALATLDDLEEKWGEQYAAMIRLWRNSWDSSLRSSPTTARSAKSCARPMRSNH